MAAAAMPSTAMLIRSAGMALSVVMAFSMVIAMDIRIIGKAPCKEGLYGLVRAAGYTPVKPDPRLSHSRLCACADPAADQHIHLETREQTGQSAMAAPFGAHHLGVPDLPVFHLVDLKILCMPEMREYISILIRYRDLHIIYFLSCRGLSYGPVIGSVTVPPAAAPGRTVTERVVPAGNA